MNLIQDKIKKTFGVDFSRAKLDVQLKLNLT